MRSKSNWSRRPKALTRPQANRAFKRKVTQKVININVKCQTVCTLPGTPCPNGGKHILVSSPELFGNAPATPGYNDAMRITRLEGTLWGKPDYSNVALDAGAGIEAPHFLRQPTIFRMGLLKSQVTQVQGGVPLAVNPLSDGTDPFHLADAVDQRWLKTWDHLYQPIEVANFGIQTMPFGGFKSPGYIVPPIVAGEQIGYVVPPDLCDVCDEDQGAGTSFESGIRMPGWHPFRMAYRRPIVLKENDSLDLFFGWELMRTCNDDELRNVNQPPMMWVGHVFMTVES